MRLIEAWLDNQTERRYQPAFIQLLVSEGWTILHNTRHSPIEIGKDVIARDGSGTLYCFQLKGNPGTRLKKREAASLVEQLIELIDISPSDNYIRSKNEKHVSVLVTNGEVDEEAMVLLDGLNKRTGSKSCPSKRFEVWARGRILKLVASSVNQVWPTTLDGIKKMIEIQATNGRTVPAFEDISELFSLSNPKPLSEMKAPDKDSLVSGILVLTEIAKGSWYDSNNHYALMAISIIAIVHCLPFADAKKRKELLLAYSANTRLHAKELIDECIEVGFEPGFVWSERDMLGEAHAMVERQRLIGIGCALLILSNEKVDEAQESFIVECLKDCLENPRISGFYSLPSLIIMFLALERLDATLHAERLLIRILSVCLSTNGRTNESTALPAPYYSFVEIWKFNNNTDPVSFLEYQRDSWAGRSWFLRSIFFMLAKRNWKQTCKSLWTSFSLLQHEEPDLPFLNFCSPILSDDGEVVTKLYHGQTWISLLEEGISEGIWPDMSAKSEFDWIAAIYVAIIPYRASAQSLMWLDQQIARTWYSSEDPPS